MKPRNSGVENPNSPDFPECPDFFSESPGFILQTLNHKLCISSMDHISLPYLFIYPDGASEGPTQDRGALHSKED
jgi:hypothetical protein